MKLFNIFKKNKKRFVTQELISLNALAKVPDIDYFKDNNQFLLLINLRKKEYLETLIKEKVLTSSELKSDELQDKLNMLHNLIEQNTLGNDLFEKVIFDEEDKVKALIILRKFTIYNEKIIELEEEVVSRIIALKEILKRTFLNKPKRISIINEVNRLTNVFIVLMNQKETLRVCLSNYGKKCFDITKERDLEKEEALIKKRKKELNEYQKQAFGKINTQINNLNDMAEVEVALENYVYNYKEKALSLKDEIIYLYNHIEKDIDNQSKDVDQLLTEILALENKCKIFYEFGKNIIDNEDLKRIYHLKFMTFINCQKKDLIEPFVNEETSSLELGVYEKLIFGFINDLSKNDKIIFQIKTIFIKDYLTVIKLVKEELKTNEKYDSLEILKDKYKLNLLMAFSHPINMDIIKKIYKKIYVKRCNYPEVNFYEPVFGWNEELPLETINELKLMQNQKQDLDLYLILKEYYYSFYEYYVFYNLLEGLEKVTFLPNSCANVEKLPQQIKEITNFIKIIRQKMAGRIVVFPKSLKYVFGDLIGDTEILELRLNEKLEYINFSPNANIEEIKRPVKALFNRYRKQNISTIHFYNFDKSHFYNNIENLKNLLDSYINVSLHLDHRKLYELTIDRIIFDFSNINQIILKRNEWVFFQNEYPTETAIYKYIEHLNDLIMHKIAENRGIEKRKLTK